MQIFNLSINDELTGLYNRRGFLMLSQQQLKMAYRTGTPFLVIFVDLDGLKCINDSFGHQEGNHALVDTASILKDSFRQSDLLARIGGDEFAVYVTDACGDDSNRVVTRLQEKLQACNDGATRAYKLSFSIGVAQADVNNRLDIEGLLKQADAAMYHDKRCRQVVLPRSLAAGQGSRA
jgi:diguanylate cyclase (GGDEF)-like protein